MKIFTEFRKHSPAAKPEEHIRMRPMPKFHFLFTLVTHKVPSFLVLQFQLYTVAVDNIRFI